MKKKNKKKKLRKIRVPHPYDRPHLFLIAQIVVVYFLLVAGFILLADKLSLPLTADPANPWYALILVLYYFLPFVLAVMFGVVFPPLWVRVRNLLLAILIIQFLFSAGMFIKRNEYLNGRFDAMTSSRRALFVVGRFRHELRDDNQNGQIDAVSFKGKIEASECPEGEYILFADLSAGPDKLPHTEIVIHRFRMAPGEHKTLKLSFKGQVARFAQYFGKKDFYLNIGVRRLLPLDAQGEKIRFYCRWMPFLRATAWDGEDPELKDQIVDLDYFPRVDTFAVIPLVINP